jgi:hypothetical protein
MDLPGAAFPVTGATAAATAADVRELGGGVGR